jgi:hypothetical protein
VRRSEMSEVFPIAAGLAMGTVLALVAPRLRPVIGVIAAVVLGTAATLLSGEYKIGWEFLLVDIPLVGVSSLASLLLIRRLRAWITQRGLSRPSS